MSQANNPSPVQLPPGEFVVRVSMMSPAVFGPVVLERFMAPAVPGLATLGAIPSLCFLLEHPTGRKLVWDLAVRKDWHNYAPDIAAYIPTTNYAIHAPRNVADILQDNGVDLHHVEAVVWSHWHWDHVGDPSSFPTSTKLVVGRGFKQAMLPGAPANPRSPILESDYAGRELEEITFQGPSCLQIGQFPAYDYFGDGSFYLLDSPGHAVGHLCGLVRTTTTRSRPPGSDASTFVLLGGDVCHYPGILRPSRHQPLPPQGIAPHPCTPHDDASVLCPGRAWDDLQTSRGRRPADALFGIAFGLDPAVATRTAGWLQELDCHPNVFVVLAHDATVHEAAPRFPAQSLNEWKAQGLGTRTRWAFLRDLECYWKSKGLA